MQKLGEAKAQIATLRVDVSVDGAAVSVDGVELGRAPLREELYVEPGLRSFRASHEGLRGGRGAHGARRGFELQDRALAPAAPGDGALGYALRPGGARGRRRPKPLWPALALGGVTAVGAGLGITFTLMGIGEESDLEGVTCPGGPETCPERRAWTASTGAMAS
jgi:hypothetical protein